ncbi:MAG TPA: hypothetical protein VMA36_17110 [Candidatus Limnocylindria bacterium]|jgi:hypothetical protein|nr:hypothetical protein [Candidatus Limnocylindria bacterium]
MKPLVLGFALTAAFVVVMVGGAVEIFSNFPYPWLAHTTFYPKMLAHALSDQRVIATLGAPIRPGTTTVNTYESGGASESANFNVLLHGAKHSAWLHGQFFNGSEAMWLHLDGGKEIANVGEAAYRVYHGPSYTGLYWRADGSILSVHQFSNGAVHVYLQPLPDDSAGHGRTTAASVDGTLDLDGAKTSMGTDECFVDLSFGTNEIDAQQNGPSDLCHFSPDANATGRYVRVTTRDVEGPAPNVNGLYRRGDGSSLRVSDDADTGLDLDLAPVSAQAGRVTTHVLMQVDRIQGDGSVRLEPNPSCTIDMVFEPHAVTITQRDPGRACGIDARTDASGRYAQAEGRVSSR